MEQTDNTEMMGRRGAGEARARRGPHTLWRGCVALGRSVDASSENTKSHCDPSPLLMRRPSQLCNLTYLCDGGVVVYWGLVNVCSVPI